MTASERVLLGKIVGVHGLQGWLKVHSDTQPREAIGEYSNWCIGRSDDWTTSRVASVRRQGKRVLAKLKGCNTLEDAEALVGCTVAVTRDQLPALRDDQFYWRDLIGLEVVNLQGTALGHVAQVFDTGANDVLVVKGEEERLIPWILDEVVTEVDLDSGTLRVDWGTDY
ncbi:MAG: ribosome maturation factor RimM [Pseudomonadota bacterium]